MTSKPISIIGAGIGGLVLGRRLQHRGVACIVYEKDSLSQARKRHGYGITIQSHVYRRLLDALRLDDVDFRKRVAIGRIADENVVADGGRDIQANRQRLEQVLGEGLDIRWDYQVQDVKLKASADTSNTILFDNETEVQSDIIVGADGPHSRTRKIISPSSRFEVLPYAVYRGRRRIDKRTWDSDWAPYVRGLKLQHKQGDALLQISIDDYDADNTSISYTYSRPARKNDSLFHPDRPNAGAQDISQELFEEVAALQGLKAPFDLVFNAEAMKNDRLLNWLMRSVLVNREELDTAANGGILLLGDAAHHGPILGSLGANQAVIDAIELADFFAENDGKDLKRFCEARYDSWTNFVSDSKTDLAKMHSGQNKSAL